MGSIVPGGAQERIICYINAIEGKIYIMVFSRREFGGQ